MRPWTHPAPASSAGAGGQSAPSTMKERIEAILATVFGSIFLLLSVVVVVETVSRKVFNISIQGADELGGYALAVGSTISFSLALMGRNHIRVDVFHEKFGPRLQAFLNWLSIVLLAVLGVFIAWVAFKVLGDTLQYGSTAQTPWATPLIIPQSVWYAGLVTFALVAVGYCHPGHGVVAGGPAGKAEHRLPSEECQGRTQGRTARPGPAPGREHHMSLGYFGIAFALMLAMMLIGLPIAVSMSVVGIVGGLMAYGVPFMDSIAPVVWGVQNENLLTSIPLFVLLGELLLRSGIADRMYIALSAWLGRLPGGLLHTNIGSCALFAATSGSSVATAATIGTVALPSLQKRGYPMRASLGSLAAGGTLGILIPPSVNMIVYGSLTNNSIGKLFIAGIIPGLLLTGSFMLYIAVSSLMSGNAMREPVVPMAERVRTLRHLVAPLVVFGIVMGSLYFGIATATESAALGVIAALFFVWQSGKLTWEVMRTCFISTARVSGMILLIIMAAFILNLTVSLTGVADAMTKWVTSLGLSGTTMILTLIVFYLILGMFMDVLSMQVATIPITYPIVTALGVDPIWYGIFIVLMCELGLITPPVGMNLFVVHGIRPDKGGIEDAIWGALPYAVIMIAFTLLMLVWPQIVLWLPGKMLG